MPSKSFGHPFPKGKANSSDAEDYLRWIRAGRVFDMDAGAARCHHHLMACPDCLRRLTVQLGDPDDKAGYAAGLSYLFDLYDALGGEPVAGTDGPRENV